MSTENNATGCLPTTPVCIDCDIQNSSDNDSIGIPTILGRKLDNPYSYKIVSEAYFNLYGEYPKSLTPTHYYIKIISKNKSELEYLDENDIDIYDHPLEYEIIQDGDYYPIDYDVSNPNMYPDLYAIIEKEKPLQGGIVYQILEELYIPANNDLLEDEALFLSNNLDCPSVYIAERQQILANGKMPVPPCDFNVDDCNGGGSGSGSGTGPTSPLNPRIPNGQIKCKTYIDNASNRIGVDAPLKYVKIVARRGFKKDYCYTDFNGNYKFNKSFPKKVSLMIKMRTSEAKGINRVSQEHKIIGIWRKTFAISKKIGTFKGASLNNINFELTKGNVCKDKGTRNWVAAVTINATTNYNEYLELNGLMKLPNKIRLVLGVNVKGSGNLNSGFDTKFDFIRRSETRRDHLIQPSFSYNNGVIFPIIAASSVGAGWVAATSANSPTAAYAGAAGSFLIGMSIAFGMFEFREDVMVNYYIDDINKLKSSHIALNIGNHLGNFYIKNLLNTTSDSHFLKYFTNYELIVNGDPNVPHYPFGTKTGSQFTGVYSVYAQPQLTAIYQSIIQSQSHKVVDQMYGTGIESFILQNKTWSSSNIHSASADYLEKFNPEVPITDDAFNWIPVGLIHDLMDNNIDFINNNVNKADIVSGFTLNDLEFALKQNPLTMQDFKNSLINLKPAQATNINNLFNYYGW